MARKYRIVKKNGLFYPQLKGWLFYDYLWVEYNDNCYTTRSYDSLVEARVALAEYLDRNVRSNGVVVEAGVI